jgi:hypothetical protein
MNIKKRTGIRILLVLAACLVFGGCEGSDSRDAVTDTVEELAGKKKLDQMDQMKDNIADINRQQADRLKETAR